MGGEKTLEVVCLFLEAAFSYTIFPNLLCNHRFADRFFDMIQLERLGGI